MRTRKEIEDNLFETKLLPFLEVLLDIRKLLIIGINSALAPRARAQRNHAYDNEYYAPLCEECGETKILRKVFPDRKDGPEEYVCLRCEPEEGS